VDTPEDGKQDPVRCAASCTIQWLMASQVQREAKALAEDSSRHMINSLPYTTTTLGGMQHMLRAVMELA
jgi:hypothetical protein